MSACVSSLASFVSGHGGLATCRLCRSGPPLSVGVPRERLLQGLLPGNKSSSEGVDLGLFETNILTYLLGALDQEAVEKLRKYRGRGTL